MTEEKKIDRNSMLYWFPKTEPLPIPQPRTIIVELENVCELNPMLDDDFECLEPYQDQIDKATESLGFPLFLRTDQSSGKHGWKDTCYVKNREKLERNMAGVIEENAMAGILGLPYKALVFRQYIPMHSKFKAFYGMMPVSSERRYFVKDGEIVCRHPYWPPEAIEKTFDAPRGWKHLLAQMNKQSAPERATLGVHARDIAEVMDGAWSVDFCKSFQGRWYFIDMAVAEDSWHWPECPHNIFNPEKKPEEDATAEDDQPILERMEKSMGADYEGDEP